MVEIVNLRTCKDWGKPGDVRIDRKTKWGNPFKIGRGVTRKQSIDSYEEYFIANLMSSLKELDGALRLGCWCKPLPCHGDVIKKYFEKWKIGE
jgi:hypothetical protein